MWDKAKPKLNFWEYVPYLELEAGAIVIFKLYNIFFLSANDFISCIDRVFQEMLYGISTGFGSPQVPVAEILARAAPSPPTAPKPKSSNFLQVPDIEGPR